MLSAVRSTVLVVDDEESIRNYLSEVLQFEGYECICFSESLAALAYLTRGTKLPDLMLADISMPDLGGIELLRSAKSMHPGMPVILVSGLYELALALEAIDAGADDYLRKPVLPSEVATLVGKYLQPDSRQRGEDLQASIRELLAEQPSNFESSERLRDVFRKLGFKRYETFQHSKRVAAYAVLLGRRCGLPKKELDSLRLGALLHDIGKIGVPRNVLQKPGNLTADEWQVMRSHPLIGYRLLSAFPELRIEADIVRSHHEEYSGSGYPQQLQGEAIPYAARLFSIVDTFDAITSDRPYRPAQSITKACEEIGRMAGGQFDPALVREFLQIPVRDLEVVRKQYPDAAGDEELMP
ncbi:MAG: HD domain-containing phosphohydrolase [Bryobacterales bacterium]